MSDETLELVKAFLPVGLAAITIIGGAIIYWFQKRLDRQNQILQERRVLYRSFIGKAQQLLTHRITKNRDGATADYQVFKVLLAELLVTAPDGVVAPLKVLDENIAKALAKTFGGNREGDVFGDETDLPTVLVAVNASFDEVVAEMRKDSFNNTQFSAQLLEGALRISTGVMRP